ncbi:hypothetical protein [Lentzea sp. NPDC055074]
MAQQLLALCLQENRHLVYQGFLEQDGELLFIGPSAEQKFGGRHFMDTMAVFTAPQQFTVLHGRREIGPPIPPC